MKLLRIQEVLTALIRNEGNVDVLGISTLDGEINIYYNTEGETRIYKEEERLISK